LSENRCMPKCKLDDAVFIAETANPNFPNEKTAKYSLLGCKACESLREIRRGPEEDRWGSSKSETVEIDYDYAKKTYDLSVQEIKNKLYGL
jgi:hypothetical protein